MIAGSASTASTSTVSLTNAVYRIACCRNNPSAVNRAYAAVTGDVSSRRRRGQYSRKCDPNRSSTRRQSCGKLVRRFHPSKITGTTKGNVCKTSVERGAAATVGGAPSSGRSCTPSPELMTTGRSPPKSCTNCTTSSRCANGTTQCRYKHRCEKSCVSHAWSTAYGKATRQDQRPGETRAYDRAPAARA